jgi:hypothetical protein
MIFVNGVTLIILIICSLVLYKKAFRVKDGYKGWSENTMTSFNNYKSTSLPNVQFNMEVVQKQTDDSDVQYLIDHGHWKWSDETKQIYQNAMAASSSTKGDPGIGLIDTQKTYNENAVKQALAWDAKEGRFLIYGAGGPSTKSLTKEKVSWIKSDNGADDNNGGVYKCADDCGGEPRIQYFDNASDVGVVVPLEELPNQIPGFQFLRGVCNPCEALKEDAQYNCPFSIQTGAGADAGVSEVWSNLWSL